MTTMLFIEDLLAQLPFEFSALLFIGSAVALGFLLGKATHWVKLTAIVGYIVAGILLGPVLGIVHLTGEMSGFIVNLTLAFVAFIIGLGFTKKFIKRTGKVVGIVTIIQSLLTFIVVSVGVFTVAFFIPGIDLKLAVGLGVIFGVLGLATAPAGTIAALHESRARGAINKITMGIVGLDDALAVIVFVIGLAAVSVFLGGGISKDLIFESIFIEILGAIALGIFTGLGLSFIFRVLRDREEMFIVSVGGVLVTAGLAEVIGSSVIMACMVQGVVFVNRKPREGKVISSTIEGLIPVIFIVFFVTAGLDLGAGLDLNRDLLILLFGLGTAYVVCRVVGKYLGAYLGCWLANTRSTVRKYLGFALLSQAGVAIGLALLVSHELDGVGQGAELGAIAITVITATTVIFEIAGPQGVKFAVNKVQGPPKSVEEKIIAKMSRTADEVNVFKFDVDEDICVYAECEDEDFVYAHEDTLVVVDDDELKSSSNRRSTASQKDAERTRRTSSSGKQVSSDEDKK